MTASKAAKTVKSKSMGKLHEKLSAIQQDFKSKKSRYNSFGKYKYRNQEDVLEAVKPLLAKHSLNLIITDEVKEVANLAMDKFTNLLINFIGKLG